MAFDPSTATLFDPSTAVLVEEEEEKKQPEKVPSLYSAMYPRLTKVEETGEGSPILATGLDILSMPGRVVGAGMFAEGKQRIGTLTPEQLEQAKRGEPIKLTPEQMAATEKPLPSIGEQYKRSFAQTEAPEGAGLGRSIVEGAIRDPATLPAMAAGGGLATLPLKGSAKALPIIGETVASVAAHQAEYPARGEEMRPGEAVLESAVSLGVPGTLNVVGKLVNKLTGRAASQLSGVSEEALRAYRGSNKTAIQQAAGLQREVGQELLNVIDNWDNFIPEVDIVNDALKTMPEIDITDILATLDRAKLKGIVKHTKGINDQIDNLALDILESATPEGKMSADMFFALRKELDDIAGDAFGKESGKYITAIKKARHTMMENLIDAAKNSGNDEYITAMKVLATKLQAVDELKSIIGKSAKTRNTRIEGFIDNLFGKNKEARQEIIQRIDDIFGKNIFEKSKLTHIASELGPGGKPTLLPRQTTGRSTLGLGIGGGAGASLGGVAHYAQKPELIPMAIAAGVVPAALSSPAFSANVALPITESLEQLGRAAVRPDITSRSIRQLGRNVVPRLPKSEEEKQRKLKQLFQGAD